MQGCQVTVIHRVERAMAKKGKRSAKQPAQPVAVEGEQPDVVVADSPGAFESTSSWHDNNVGGDAPDDEDDEEAQIRAAAQFSTDYVVERALFNYHAAAAAAATGGTEDDDHGEGSSAFAQMQEQAGNAFEGIEGAGLPVNQPDFDTGEAMDELPSIASYQQAIADAVAAARLQAEEESRREESGEIYVNDEDADNVFSGEAETSQAGAMSQPSPATMSANARGKRRASSAVSTEPDESRLSATPGGPEPPRKRHKTKVPKRTSIIAEARYRKVHDPNAPPPTRKKLDKVWDAMQVVIPDHVKNVETVADVGIIPPGSEALHGFDADAHALRAQQFAPETRADMLRALNPELTRSLLASVRERMRRLEVTTAQLNNLKVRLEIENSVFDKLHSAVLGERERIKYSVSQSM